MKLDVNKAIQEIARREGTSEREIIEAMQQALNEGMQSQDPNVRAAWRDIPCKGDKPTPQEVIMYIINKQIVSNN